MRTRGFGWLGGESSSPGTLCKRIVNMRPKVEGVWVPGEDEDWLRVACSWIGSISSVGSQDISKWAHPGRKPAM